MRPESVSSLARELQIPVPRDTAGHSYVILLLPKAREQKIAEAERRYAESQRRPVQNIRATWFDFRLQPVPRVYAAIELFEAPRWPQDPLLL